LGQREWNVLEAEVTREGEDDRRKWDVRRIQGGELEGEDKREEQLPLYNRPPFHRIDQLFQTLATHGSKRQQRKQSRVKQKGGFGKEAADC